MMNDVILYEPFDAPEFDARLAWYCPPQTWRIADSCLVIEPDAKTDYWRKTHYGFEVDNGHFLFAEVAGDFIMTTAVRFEPATQYDQAGLMVRLSPDCWLKTSVEYEANEPNKLGAVVTNFGYSDWSIQNFPDDCHALLLRVRREGSDYFVDYSLDVDAPDAATWTPIRMAHLHEDQGGGQPVPCGVYACSPLGAGYVAAFDFLKIQQGES